MRKVDPSFIVYTAEKTLLGTKKEIPADNARKVASEIVGFVIMNYFSSVNTSTGKGEEASTFYNTLQICRSVLCDPQKIHTVQIHLNHIGMVLFHTYAK